MLPASIQRIARLARAALVSPPVLGAAYLAILSAWTGTSATDADVGDTRRAAVAEAFVARSFSAEITRMRIGVLATAIAFGLVLGLVAELLLWLRGPRAGRGRWRGWLAPVESFALVVGLHAALVGWSMADSPQLYAATWYARGGLARTLQIVATDWLGTRGVVLLAVALAILYVRPSRIAALGREALTRVAPRALGLATLAIGALTAGAAAVGEGNGATSAGAAPEPARAEAPRPNVLVLAIDSLRDDRIDARRAPNLSRLATRGTRFERAYVSVPRTFPSWVTILTGRHAHHHGIRSMFPTLEERARDFDALPQRLAKSGYATTVVSDYTGDVFGRIDLGFERVDAPTFDFRQLIRQRALERETPLLPLLHSRLGRRVFPVMRQLSAAADPRLLADEVAGALRVAKDRPFFVTAFFSTAHAPYAAPAPYYARFTDPAYRGRFKYHEPMALGRAAEIAPDAADMRQIEGLYDGAVAAVDDAIGRVLGELDALGVADRTIVVVTADHGEALFEHGRGQGHGDHLFGDENTHVPLLIVDPRRPPPGGRSERGIVRDVDLAPTLYELTGTDPPSDLDGRSLAPALRGEPLGPRLAYAESELWFTEEVPGLAPELRMPYPGVLGITELDARHQESQEIVLRREMAPITLMARHRMVRDERWKLVYVPTRLGVKWLLFDTESDPSETRDVAAAHPAEVARLRAELWAWMLQDPSMEQRDGFLVPRGVR